jgi:predicted  nucleic acid-binding Zn-ribbon protein
MATRVVENTLRLKSSETKPTKSKIPFLKMRQSAPIPPVINFESISYSANNLIRTSSIGNEENSIPDAFQMEEHAERHKLDNKLEEIEIQAIPLIIEQEHVEPIEYPNRKRQESKSAQVGMLEQQNRQQKIFIDELQDKTLVLEKELMKLIESQSMRNQLNDEKIQMKATIKSLKKQVESLTEMNRNLEAKEKERETLRQQSSEMVSLEQCLPSTGEKIEKTNEIQIRNQEPKTEMESPSEFIQSATPSFQNYIDSIRLGNSNSTPIVVNESNW